MTDKNNGIDESRIEEQDTAKIEEERLELQQRLENTMLNLSMVKDEIAKSEAIIACREAFMSIAGNPMEKFGMPADFSDTRVLLDWADLIVDKFR